MNLNIMNYGKMKYEIEKKHKIDLCENVIYTTLSDDKELGSAKIAIGDLKKYLQNNQYSKNTLLGEIYSFTGKQKIQIIKDAYIQGYRDALDKLQK